MLIENYGCALMTYESAFNICIQKVNQGRNLFTAEFRFWILAKKIGCK